MDADYSVELGPTAPALELPWSDPEGRVEYIDLRRFPEQVDRLPEAQQFPALRALLMAVNGGPGPWQTAKCDVWIEAVDAAENLYAATLAQNSYLDLVLSDAQRGLRNDIEFHTNFARQLAQALEEDQHLEASAEIVLRRCYFHRVGDANDDSEEGYCLTLYLSGFGQSAAEAATRWQQALGWASGCLLGLDLHAGRAKDGELG